MYFDEKKAADIRGDKKINETVSLILKFFIENNGKTDYVMLPYFENGFDVLESSRTDIDFEKIFLHSGYGDVAYARCFIESKKEDDVIFFCDFSSDTVFYCNGKEIGKTTDCDEALGDVRKIYAHLKKGKNTLILRCRKTSLGFGAKIGRVSHRGEPFFFKTDSENIKGVLGWEYSDIYKEDIFEKDCNIISAAEKIKFKNIDSKNDFYSVFKGKSGFAYASTFLKTKKDCEVFFEAETDSPCRVFVNGSEAASGEGKLSFTYICKKGDNFISAEVKTDGNSHFDLKASQGEMLAPFEGNAGCSYMFAGTFEGPDEQLLYGFRKEYLPGGRDYWRISKDIVLRLAEGKGLFGRWSYPLGVALRGMNAWAIKTNNKEISDYIDSYIKKLTGVYEYARWDAEKYKISFVLRQQSIIELLDDFGSFESALIDIALDKPSPVLDKIIARGADFIKNKLPRLEDGTMYRKALLPLHRNINHNHLTMWADDLYMGGSFMCRYYAYSGDKAFLDDAARQFINYFKYLYIDSIKLMSHVYSLRRGEKTNVAWGRGNGWVLFSLTELLRVMPKEHKAFEEILKIFNLLCESVLSYQDINGMWHQVVNDKESFAETSCTAMFGCAFMRGIKNGWIKGDKYKEAAVKAWRALCRYSIDSEGNLYGVCKGSGFSFRENYYKKELPWVMNDTHGIGIILLFASEIKDEI